MNRRGVLHMLRRGLAVLAALVAAWPVLRFVTWRRAASRTVVFEPEEQHGRVCKQEVWLIRTGDGHVALDARCPHLCCVVGFDEAAGVFRCPCHHSAYDGLGRRLAGPARRDMDRLPIKSLPDGRIGVEVPV